MIHLKAGVSVEKAKEQVARILDVNLNCETAYFAQYGVLDDMSIFWLYC